MGGGGNALAQDSNAAGAPDANAGAVNPTEIAEDINAPAPDNAPYINIGAGAPAATDSNGGAGDANQEQPPDSNAGAPEGPAQEDGGAGEPDAGDDGADADSLESGAEDANTPVEVAGPADDAGAQDANSWILEDINGLIEDFNGFIGGIVDAVVEVLEPVIDAGWIGDENGFTSTVIRQATVNVAGGQAKCIGIKCHALAEETGGTIDDIIIISGGEGAGDAGTPEGAEDMNPPEDGGEEPTGIGDGNAALPGAGETAVINPVIADVNAGIDANTLFPDANTQAADFNTVILPGLNAAGDGGNPGPADSGTPDLNAPAGANSSGAAEDWNSGGDSDANAVGDDSDAADSR